MNKGLYFLLILFTISCSTSQISIIENGKEGKGRLKNNLKEGKWSFYQEGKIISSGYYSKNKKNGSWKFYYPNGALHQKGKFIDDKQNGLWNYYFDSGDLMGSGEIIDDKQNGLWRWLHKNGIIYTERLYSNGKLIEIKSCFDKNGATLNCGTITNGNGMMIFHDIENESEKIEEFEFENGVLKTTINL